ncbi:MAG: hypothetical protein CMF70_06765 [Magnetovibrio sp.]|nr:hypothetical protein [Magnetovibrio sp.]
MHVLALEAFDVVAITVALGRGRDPIGKGRDRRVRVGHELGFVRVALRERRVVGHHEPVVRDVAVHAGTRRWGGLVVVGVVVVVAHGHERVVRDAFQRHEHVRPDDGRDGQAQADCAPGAAVRPQGRHFVDVGVGGDGRQLDRRRRLVAQEQLVPCRRVRHQAHELDLGRRRAADALGKRAVGEAHGGTRLGFRGKTNGRRRHRGVLVISRPEQIYRNLSCIYRESKREEEDRE